MAEYKYRLGPLARTRQTQAVEPELGSPTLLHSRSGERAAGKRQPGDGQWRDAAAVKAVDGARAVKGKATNAPVAKNAARRTSWMLRSPASRSSFATFLWRFRRRYSATSRPAGGTGPAGQG